MYHRFEENKYPSTNIKINDFIKHLKIIESNNIQFINPKKFKEELVKNKKQRKVLLTIDDGFLSFYKNAWPVLKEKKIPFILFVNTREVGTFNYMTWDQIKELYKEDFVEIGNHSHSHEYLVDEKESLIIEDIEKSITIFKNKLGYNSIFFSYPFGEYSSFIKEYISKNFKFSFGQHSGVIDVNKDRYELPRFPINEKYGDLKRFKFLVNLYPLEFKQLLPNEKYLTSINNPPDFSVEFFKNQNNLSEINCFSDEGNKWEKSNVFFNKNILKIDFREKFIFRRGRINCSLNDNGLWRWFGIQFSIKTN